MKTVFYENFDKIFNLMKKSFPENEYRTYEYQKALIENPKYRYTLKIDENKNLVGFILWWELNGFSFIEHFAIDPIFRGKGIGSKMLCDFVKSRNNNPIILEVEVPKNNISKRRISFYERNKFTLNIYKYYQLPLRKNEKSCEMYLMSHPKEINPEEFEKIKSQIYENVYPEII